MIAWVKHVCQIWGQEQRRNLLGGRWVRSVGDRQWHFDGYPSRSMSDKIFREHSAAMSGAVIQHFDDVLSPDGWTVQRVYQTLPETQRVMMVGQYVARAYWKTVCAAAGFVEPDGRLAKDRYYDTWDRIHTRIEAAPRETDIRERIPVFVREQASG